MSYHLGDAAQKEALKEEVAKQSAARMGTVAVVGGVLGLAWFLLRKKGSKK